MINQFNFQLGTSHENGILPISFGLLAKLNFCRWIHLSVLHIKEVKDVVKDEKELKESASQL